MKQRNSAYEFQFNGGNGNPIYKHIAETIIKDIEKGVLEKNFLLPSINEFSGKYAVGRDTVEKAYRHLKSQEYIRSAPGKGYYVTGRRETKMKVLLVFNKLSSYKKMIYDSFIATLQKKAKVDLQIHHYDLKILKEIVDNSLGKYHYYVIMPHFFYHCKQKDILAVLQQIPSNELVLLDKSFPGIDESRCVFQDFENDIYDALVSTKEHISKYNKIVLLFPDHNHYPLEMIEGTQRFCDETGKQFIVAKDASNQTIEKGTLFIVVDDPELAKVMKAIRNSGIQLGKEVGVISFNETDLKELLDITVFTTDFEKMGTTVAGLILNKQSKQVRNPFQIILRNSI
jgi:DNA-binding transcriptional regulator YhcF (GntR family)